jgi:hypothetical protein
VLTQFLIEAVLLSTLGGVMGVMLGVGASQLVAHYMKWPILVSSLSVIIAVSFSATVGVFFGFYPARKAAQLDPIEALRQSADRRGFALVAAEAPNGVRALPSGLRSSQSTASWSISLCVSLSRC